MLDAEISLIPRTDHEYALWKQGLVNVAGIDEAGRGPLAGPVVAAAVVFPHDSAGKTINGINDSKKLSPFQRESLFDYIYNDAVSIGIGIVEASIIDEINVLQATFRAMNEAISQLHVPPDHLLIDGNRFCTSSIPYTTIVHGDALCYSIAAASIIAKVTRDRIMCAYHDLYPEYGFARHKGYGTLQHRNAIRSHGMTPIHRRSFVHIDET